MRKKKEKALSHLIQTVHSRNIFSNCDLIKFEVTNESVESPILNTR